MSELSWQKSILVCSVVKGCVIAIAEHPVTLISATANVSAVCNRVSQEAFEGSTVCLLNAKNLRIHDVDGTKGNVVCAEMLKMLTRGSIP